VLLAGAPLAFLVLLAVQAFVAVRAERLPDDPGYQVEARIGAEGSGGTPLRVALLGDSTVAGIGADTLDGSLAFQVGERVAASLDRPVQVMGYGVSGARTNDVVGAQLSRVDDFAPDVVVVVVGANDVTGLTPPWRLRADITAMADAVTLQLDAPVVLGGIPLFGGASLLAQPLRSVVDAYADVLRPTQRRAARAAGITYVEIARDASPRFAGVPEAMSSDGFHPAPVGYGFWADALAPGVLEALGSAPPG
jgi:lysophospholipase L1-like esterase